MANSKTVQVANPEAGLATLEGTANTYRVPVVCVFSFRNNETVEVRRSFEFTYSGAPSTRTHTFPVEWDLGGEHVLESAVHIPMSLPEGEHQVNIDIPLRARAAPL